MPHEGHKEKKSKFSAKYLLHRETQSPEASGHRVTQRWVGFESGRLNDHFNVFIASKIVKTTGNIDVDIIDFIKEKLVIIAFPITI